MLLLSPVFEFTFMELDFTLLAIVLLALIIGLIINAAYQERIFVMLGGLLIAILYNVMVELFALDPVLLILDERILVGVIIGVFLGFFQTSLKNKWIIAMLGLWLGSMYFILRHATNLLSVRLFSYYELDLLFILILTVALAHLLGASLTKWFKKTVRMT